MQESFAVGDQKLHIAHLRPVDGRVVHLVENAVGEGEPDAAGVGVGGAHAFLGRAGPARADARSPKGVTGQFNAASAVIQQMVIRNGYLGHDAL